MCVCVFAMRLLLRMSPVCQGIYKAYIQGCVYMCVRVWFKAVVADIIYKAYIYKALLSSPPPPLFPQAWETPILRRSSVCVPKNT